MAEAAGLSNVILSDENGDELTNLDLLGGAINVRGGGEVVIPEPSTLVLVGTCLLGLMMRQWRRA